MKLFLSIFVSAAVLMAVEVNAENSWMKTYGEGTRHEWGHSVQQTSDGGYIAAGIVEGPAFVKQVYLVKTDAWGNTKWVTYGPDTMGWVYYQPFTYVQQTSGGGYIIVGTSVHPSPWGYDIYLMKTDSVGLVSWTRSFDYVYMDEGYGVVETPDGGYLLAGYSGDGSSTAQVRLIKTDSLGNSIWTKAYGAPGHNSGGYCMVPASDSGYVIVGRYDNDVLLLKISPSGDSLWARTYGTGQKDIGFSCRQTSDGGYIIAGHTGGDYWIDGDVYLIKTNGVGIVQWEQTYGGALLDCGFSVDQASDGGYIIGGITHSSGAGKEDVYLIKTGASGNLVWQRTYGDTNGDGGYSVQQTSDGGYIIAGYTYKWTTGWYSDFYLMKTDSIGEVDIWPPEPFSLILPADSAILSTTRPTYVWESTYDLRSGLKDYTLYIGTPRYSGQDTSWTPGYDLPEGWHTWYVVAIDSAGNKRSTDTFAVLTDTTLPIIDSVTVWEDTSYAGPFPISAKVTDNFGFDSVLFYYRIGGDTAVWQASTMSDSGGGWFEDTIPAQTPADSLRIEYYLKCADWAGNYDSTAVHTFYIIIPGVEESFAMSPTVFALMSPEPNPCIGNTVIRYQLPIKAEVSLKVYDMTGRLVTVLVDGEKKAGCYTVNWDGRDASNYKVRTGIYFYRMEAGELKATKKLTMLR